MHRLAALSCVFGFLGLATNGLLLHAQPSPLTVTMTVLPPYSPLLDEWRAHPERIQLQVQNTDLVNSYQFRLSGSLEATDGSISIRTKDDYPVTPFVIGAGGVLQLNGRNYALFNQNQVTATGVDRDRIVRTGRIPEGTCTICVRALEYTTKAPLSASSPSGCNTVLIQYAEAPRIVQPVCGTALRANAPQQLLLQWTPVLAGVPTAELANIRYELLMVPVEGTKTPESALQTPGAFPFLMKRDLMVPQYQYTSVDPPLETGKTYAWRVRAYDLNKRVAFLNDGLSEVCSFQWRAVSPLCFSLTPSSPAQGSIVSGTAPRFRVVASERIQLEAVLGGTLEVFEAGAADGAAAVYARSFTGSGTIALTRHPGIGNADTLDLGFVNTLSAKESFTPAKGTSYRWKFTVHFLPELILTSPPAFCAVSQVTSSEGLFSGGTIGEVLAGTCIELAPQSPKNGGNWADATQQHFAVVAQPAIRSEAITGGRLRVWETVDTNEAFFQVKARTPVLDEGFSGNAASDILCEVDAGGGTLLTLASINAALEEKFKPAAGRWHAWMFELRYDSTSIRKDGTPCRSGSAASTPGKFENTDCFAMTVLAPEDKGEWNEGPKPRFSVSVDPAIVSSEITGGSIRLWKIEKADEDVSKRFPTKTFSFLGQPSKNLVAKPTAGEATELELAFINHDGAANTFVADTGQMYAWDVEFTFNNLKIKPDKNPCSENSIACERGVFTYREKVDPGKKPNPACVALAAVDPPDKGYWAKNAKPVFVVHATPLIRKSAILGGRLKIWELNSADEDTAAAVQRTPAFDRRFFGSNSMHLDVRADSASGTPLLLAFVNSADQYAFIATEKKSYLWRFELWADSAGIRRDSVVCARGGQPENAPPLSMGISTGNVVFTYDPSWTPGTKVPVAECVRLAAVEPPDKGIWKKNLRPQFAVSAQPPPRMDAVTGGRLEIWKMNRKNEDTTAVLHRAPAFDYSFSGNDTTLLAARVDSAGTPRIDLRLLNHAGSSQSFTAEHMASYLWRFSLHFDGSRIRKDSACTRSSVRSAWAVFTCDSNAAPAECVDICSIEAPELKTAGSQEIKANDSLKIGRFTLVLQSASGTPSALNGTGLIHVPFLKRVQVAVEFFGVAVNEKNEIYDGTVQAMQAEDSPLTPEVANGLGTQLGMTQEQVNMTYSFATDGARLLSNAWGHPVKLPVGFDNVIEGNRMVIGIIGIVFTPTGASLNAVAKYELPWLGPDIGIGLGARNICFHPEGLGGDGRGQLYLASDIGFRKENEWGFVFKSPTESGGVMTDSGTYVAWNCRGFEALRIAAQAEFPRTWLLPLNEAGEIETDPTKLVTAQFSVIVRKQAGWMARASIGSFAPAENPDWRITVEEAAIDLSDLDNPEGIVFHPDKQVPEPSESWKGFFIKTAELALPEGLSTIDGGAAPVIRIENLLIDRLGFTAGISVKNLIPWPKGNFAGWGASMDSLGLSFVNNSFAGGGFAGKILVPICTNGVQYTCTLARSKKDTSLTFTFNLKAEDNVAVNLWVATMNWTPGCTIVLERKAKKWSAEATLSGILSLSDQIGNVPGVNLRGIEFEGFGVRTKTPHFVAGTWSVASPEHGVAGFPISVSNIDVVEQNNESGIRFDVNLNLISGANGVASSTTLTVFGEPYTTSEGAMRYRYKRVQLDAIRIAADFGSALHAEGLLTFYRGDAVYGNGFYGAVTATFAQLFQVDAVIQVGAVRGFRYWYCDSKFFKKTGVPFPAPLSMVGFYGFGGGAWQKMRRDNTGDPPVPVASGDLTKLNIGTSLSGYRYIPDDSRSFGFRAMVILGSYPSPKAFNCDVAFEAEFLQQGGLGRITVQGQSYKLADILEREKAKVVGTADLTYDFPAKTFHGTIDMRVQDSDPVSAHGTAVIHVEPNKWHVMLGRPDSRIEIKVADWLTTDGYLMVGNDLPAPMTLPSKISNRPSAGNRDANVARGKGAILGASRSFNSGRQKFLKFFGQVEALFGMDASLLEAQPGVECGGFNPVGINGWYAQAQLYAWLEATVGMHVDIWFWEGDIEILKASVSAVLQGGGPRPFWAKGSVEGKYSVLKGAVKGKCRFQFTKGTTCQPFGDGSLDKIDLITDLQPANGSRDVDVFVEPIAAFYFDLESSFDLSEYKNDGSVKVRTYMLPKPSFTVSKPGSSFFTATSITGTVSISEDGTQAKFTSKDILPGSADLFAAVQVKALEWVDKTWKDAKTKDGKVLTQTKAVQFRTGIAPDYIPQNNVAYSNPFHHQRFYLKSLCNQGIIVLKRGQPDLFRDYKGNAAQVQMLLEKAGVNDTVVSNAAYDFDKRQVTFLVPALANSTLYGLRIMTTKPPEPEKQKKTGSGGGFGSLREFLRMVYENKQQNVSTEVRDRKLAVADTRVQKKIVYTSHFATSKYNTVTEKAATFSQSLWGRTTLGDISKEIISSTMSTGEALDSYDLQGVSYERDGAKCTIDPLFRLTATKQNTPWHTQFVIPTLYSSSSPIRTLMSGNNLRDAIRRYSILGAGGWASFEAWLLITQFNTDAMPKAEYGSTPADLLRDSDITGQLNNNSFDKKIIVRYQHGAVESTRYDRAKSTYLKYGENDERKVRFLKQPFHRLYTGSYPVEWSYGYGGCGASTATKAGVVSLGTGTAPPPLDYIGVPDPYSAPSNAVAKVYTSKDIKDYALRGYVVRVGLFKADEEWMIDVAERSLKQAGFAPVRQALGSWFRMKIFIFEYSWFYKQATALFIGPYANSGTAASVLTRARNACGCYVDIAKVE